MFERLSLRVCNNLFSRLLVGFPKYGHIYSYYQRFAVNDKYILVVISPINKFGLITFLIFVHNFIDQENHAPELSRKICCKGIYST